jgi:hypothetical protein
MTSQKPNLVCTTVEIEFLAWPDVTESEPLHEARLTCERGWLLSSHHRPDQRCFPLQTPHCNQDVREAKAEDRHRDRYVKSSTNVHRTTLTPPLSRRRSRRCINSRPSRQSRFPRNSSREERFHRRTLQSNPPRRLPLRPRPFPPPPPPPLPPHLRRARNQPRSRRRPAPEMRPKLQHLVRRRRARAPLLGPNHHESRDRKVGRQRRL